MLSLLRVHIQSLVGETKILQATQCGQKKKKHLFKRLVQVSWWEVLVPAHWYMELGLVPLVSSCGLRKTLGRMSADGWGCVPTVLVVWPEASQNWSL